MYKTVHIFLIFSKAVLERPYLWNGNGQKRIFSINVLLIMLLTGAELGFLVGGGANPPGGGGRQHTNLPDVPKNCMKLRKFWSGGASPIGSATG